MTTKEKLYEQYNIQRRDNKVVEFISVGNIKYNPKSSEIENNGKTTIISGQSKIVFDYFIENHHRSVTRKELCQLLWGNKEVPETRFYQVIVTLRKKLGDSRPWKIIDNPSTNLFSIKPKVVFHFQTEQQRGRLRRFNFATLTLSLLISISVLAFSFKHQESSYDYTIVESESVTDIKGEVQRAAVSADGKFLLFTHKAYNSPTWYLKAKRLDGDNLLNTGEIKTLITGKHGEHNTEPAFSPLGNKIAWVKTDYKKYCSVMVATFVSESLSILNPRNVLDCSIKNFARTPQWRSETSLLISLPQGINKPNGIEELDLNTNKRTKITSPNESVHGDYSLFYHNKSKKIAYLRQSITQGTGSELRIYDFLNEKDYLLKSYPHPLFSVAWLNAENIIARGDNEFEIVNVSGLATKLKRLNNTSLYFPFAIGENSVGFVSGKIKDKDIVKYDLSSREKDNSLSSSALDHKMAMAKKSGDVVFVSTRDGKHQLLLARDRHITPLVRFRERDQVLDLAISSNGKYIAFMLDSQLNVIDNTGELYLRKNITTIGLSFTFDDTKLIAAIKEDSRVKVVSYSISDGFKRTEVVDGFMPKTTHSGDIYYFDYINKSKQPTLFRRTSLGEITKLFEVSFPLFRSTSFDVIDEKLYYVDSVGDTKILVSRDLNTDDISAIIPVDSMYFSLDESVSQLVSTIDAPVQNDLIRLRVER
ncbi:winged helix-turn-helix domain-containing protein [Aliikangiella coralliicola]|uniref:OmpR/PhoB-type domain-containing protein n=1 Tax=Aliikangiella coralliicola TaxID=2592383 RepID=A0A545UC14_9GAMM|nr:helix-turn-helix domain-containing protein [Aliikangiella coralliicola]TQV87004.1 hypothetical protein FLL46_14450 [Aliikangiella coralliicola]